MTLQEISILRLINQQVGETTHKTAEEVVKWMGAMQAQDYNMAKWAIGLRLQGSTDQLIEEAIAKAEIIRTHLLRPTWHFVSAKDIYWMLDLTAPQIKSLLKTRHKQLELTSQVLNESLRIIEKELAEKKFLTRGELILELKKGGILTDDQRSAHILLGAELDQLICNGPIKGKQQTYSLLAQRVPIVTRLPREEALAELAKRYFTSHGPATVQDFSWWAGLTITESKRGFEMVKPGFNSETINAGNYLFPNTFPPKGITQNTLHLLPAFDEFLISYKDRTPSIPLHLQKNAFTTNGIFRPVIVVNGQAAGIWSRTIKKDTIILTTEFFKTRPAGINKNLEKTATDFSRFLGIKVLVLN